MARSQGIKLDFDRPYGNIQGAYDERPGALYTQDGFFFDAQGNPVLSAEDKKAHQKALEDQLAALKATDTTETAAKPDTEVKVTADGAVVDQGQKLADPAAVKDDALDGRPDLVAPAPTPETPEPPKPVEEGIKDDVSDSKAKSPKKSALPKLPE